MIETQNNFGIDSFSWLNNTGTVQAITKNSKGASFIVREEDALFNVAESDREINQTVNVELSDAEFVHAYVDASDPPKVNEPKTNNYVAVPVVTDKVDAYVSVVTGNSYANDAIEDYINLFVNPTSESKADVKIYVSLLDKNPEVKSKRPSSRNARWYVDSSTIYFNGDATPFQRPYAGLVIGGADCLFSCNNDIFVLGKDMEGVVAATKRLINARTKFLKKSFSSRDSIIENTDILGISVMDLMHNPENNQNCRDKSADFQKVVEKILTDNNFEIAIKTVISNTSNTQNSTLRLKNLNSDFSNDYKSAITKSVKPVVMSGGIFSDLTTFEDGLGGELAEEGYDVWTIEMTGELQFKYGKNHETKN